jgi:cytochrome c
MKKHLPLIALLVLPTLASAQDATELAKAKNCLACHSVTAKVVGPAYVDVADKYRGKKGAEDELTQKVLKGTSGTWGPVPMPPNSQVSDAEARTLVKWILSLKK